MIRYRQKLSSDKIVPMDTLIMMSAVVVISSPSQKAAIRVCIAV